MEIINVKYKLILLPLFMSTLALVLPGCVHPQYPESSAIVPPAQVPELMPGILQGYLQPESLPSSVQLVPPPASANTPAAAMDQKRNAEALLLQGTPRWEWAAADANLSFPSAANTFACAADFIVAQEQMPHVVMLMRRSLTDAGLSTYGAKKKYHRLRPYAVNQQAICVAADQDKLVANESYPSGHSAIGWGWALLLTELVPERANQILARGRAFGDSRVICNVHWQSDVEEGRVMAAATLARLHADPTFLAELALAKAEMKNQQLQRPDAAACQIEATALNLVY